MIRNMNIDPSTGQNGSGYEMLSTANPSPARPTRATRTANGTGRWHSAINTAPTARTSGPFGQPRTNRMPPADSRQKNGARNRDGSQAYTRYPPAARHATAKKWLRSAISNSRTTARTSASCTATRRNPPSSRRGERRSVGRRGRPVRVGSQGTARRRGHDRRRHRLPSRYTTPTECTGPTGCPPAPFATDRLRPSGPASARSPGRGCWPATGSPSTARGGRSPPSSPRRASATPPWASPRPCFMAAAWPARRSGTPRCSSSATGGPAPRCLHELLA